MTDDPRERKAGEVLEDFRRGRISARMRDALLRDLGYEYVGSQANRKHGGGRRFKIGGKG